MKMILYSSTNFRLLHTNILFCRVIIAPAENSSEKELTAYLATTPTDNNYF